MTVHHHPEYYLHYTPVVGSRDARPYARVDHYQDPKERGHPAGGHQ